MHPSNAYGFILLLLLSSCLLKPILTHHCAGGSSLLLDLRAGRGGQVAGTIHELAEVATVDAVDVGVDLDVVELTPVAARVVDRHVWR